MARHAIIALRLLPILLAVALCVALASPTTSSGWEWVAGPSRTEARPWWFEQRELPLEGRTARIRVDAPYCAGESPPTIHHLRVARTSNRVVIRAYVRWPEPLQVSGQVEPGDPSPACAGLVAGLHRRVVIGPQSRHRKLLDGYFRPPRFVAAQ